MTQFFYKRDVVPVGEDINLDVQFADAAGNFKDADAYPSVGIVDINNTVVRTASSTNVIRLGTGLYRLIFTVPEGFASGTWDDNWSGSVDGYTVGAGFSFYVSSIGSIEAVTTVVEPLMEIGDDPNVVYTQEEIKGINVLLQLLQSRLRNQALTPNGTPCPVVPIPDLVNSLRTALSEFNAMPTLTFFSFADLVIYGIFADIIVEGAFLQALSAVAILSSGQELVVNDNGVTLQPPPVSATINTVISNRQTFYIEKLKGAKRNLRPGARGMGAGRILANNPQINKLRHRKENQLII